MASVTSGEWEKISCQGRAGAWPKLEAPQELGLGNQLLSIKSKWILSNPPLTPVSFVEGVQARGSGREGGLRGVESASPRFASWAQGQAGANYFDSLQPRGL